MTYKKPSPQDLRRKNRKEILRKICFNKDISRLDVSTQLGISPATATNIVTDLVSKKILIETGIRRSESGRPSTLLALNPDYGFIIGVEVGETYIRCELFDLTFNHVNGYEHMFANSQITEEGIVEKIVQSISFLTKKNNIKQNEIIGIGIGFPGLVDPIKGLSIFTPNWGWHNISIIKQLSAHIKSPIYIDNGANLMAVGESLFGAGKDLTHFVVLLMGTGVGTGIFADGTIFRGSTNNAGEFGHTTINPKGPKCRCGNNGCFEVYLGAPGIVSRYLEANPTEPLESRDQIDQIKEIINLAEKGNEPAKIVVEETIEYLGICIANIINTINPMSVLLGGWSGLLFGQKYLSKIEAIVVKHALNESIANTSLKLTQLGKDSVAKGAAGLVLEHFFEGNDQKEDAYIGGQAVA